MTSDQTDSLRQDFFSWQISSIFLADFWGLASQFIRCVNTLWIEQPGISDYFQNFSLRIAKVINRTNFGRGPNSNEDRKLWIDEVSRFSTDQGRRKDGRTKPITAINHYKIKQW
jgi:hypothetical protein